MGVLDLSDPPVGDGTAQNFATEHAEQHDIGRIDRSPRNLLGTFQPGRGCSEQLAEHRCAFLLRRLAFCF